MGEATLEENIYYEYALQNAMPCAMALIAAKPSIFSNVIKILKESFLHIP